MSIQQYFPPLAIGCFITCWKKIRRGYRTLNKVTYHALSVLFKLLIIAYFIFCALFLSLRHVILPNIANYKSEVEKMASHAIGNKVSIAAIHASWRGLRPHLALTDVAIYDKFGNESLRLPGVSATVSWLSAVAGSVQLHTLEISRPDMDVRRDYEGNLYVAGIFIDTNKRGDTKGADWVLSQREIVIRGGRLRWNDNRRAAPELILNDVNFVLRNNWREHRFALKATPPAAYSDPIDVRAVFSHPRFAASLSNVRLWKGVLFTDVRNTDLAAWQAYIDFPIDMRQGKGTVRSWLHFDHAKIADFTADLALANVVTHLGKDMAPLSLLQADGRISIREEINSHSGEGKSAAFGAHGHEIALTDFSLQTTDGLVLPVTTIREKFVPARKGKPEQTEIMAKVLDLKALADLAERLPLPEEQHRLLADLAPQGVLKDFSLQWQGTYPHISTYNIKGQFQGLTLNAQPPRLPIMQSEKHSLPGGLPAIPGFTNLSGQINASNKGGIFSLASENLQIQLPDYFTEPAIPFDHLNLQASWNFMDQERILFEVHKMDFMQGALLGALSGRHVMSLNPGAEKSYGTIDLNGKLTGLDLKKIGTYLPLKTPPALRTWLTGALAGGTIEDIRLRIKGDVAHIPFHSADSSEKNKGEFSIAGKIRGGMLNYTPGHYAKDGTSPVWPLLEDMTGTIAFNHAKMEIQASSAKSAGVALSNIKAVIPDLATHDLLLGIEGEGTGTLQDFVRFVNTSPVADWTAHFTEETKASGNARLSLKLALPLARLAESKVQGGLTFLNNNVTLQNAMPPLLMANGKLDFSEKGFNLEGIKANFLGGPVTLSGGMQHDGGTVVRAEGNVSAEGIRKAYPTYITGQSAERIAGGTRYSTSIRIKNKRPEVLVESNLLGMALDFPVPLRKSANEALPFKFELNGLPSSEAAPLRDEIRLSLGPTIAAYYERERPLEKEAQWRVVRGGIGVNVPPPLPAGGLIANVSLQSLNIDTWSRAFTSIVESGRSQESLKKAEATLNIAQYIEPEVLAARAAELTIMGKKLDNVVVGASHQQGMWQANIASDQASGHVTWDESLPGRGLGRVTARLASLTIPKSAASDVTELLVGKNTSSQLPGLDIIAENFELFGKKFGHLELVANNARGNAGREWHISKLSIVNPDGDLKASGKWVSGDGESVSDLSYALTIADAGKLLERFGFAHVLRGGKGKMAGDVSWKGLPFSLDIPSLSGKFQLDITSGQFLKVDPSAAKLLGVLSMQSLPRRLALDFRDVFSEGFAFDAVTADAVITQGVANTNNFKMRGIAATVLLDGTADIAKESQNLHVVVLPDINVGTASVVYALAVNPVIGVGTFLAQLFLREPLMKAFTYEYQVTGPWKEPIVTKLVRSKSLNSGEDAGARFVTPG